MRRGIGGAAALLVAYLGATGLLVWGTAGAISAIKVAAAPAAAPVGAQVAAAAAVAAWAVLTWLTAVTVAAVLTGAVAGVGSRAHDRALALAPVAARRLAGALLGLTVASAPLVAAVPAFAAQTADRPSKVAAASFVASSDGSARDRNQNAGPERAAPTPTGRPSLDRPAAGVPHGWTPDRPARGHRPSAYESSIRLVTAAPHGNRHPVDEVVVRRGDTLWDIAARQLGAPASAAEIAREWPRWYAANRAVIGPDPDLLLPGQRLTPPTT